MSDSGGAPAPSIAAAAAAAAAGNLPHDTGTNPKPPPPSRKRFKAGTARTVEGGAGKRIQFVEKTTKEQLIIITEEDYTTLLRPSSDVIADMEEVFDDETDDAMVTFSVSDYITALGIKSLMNTLKTANKANLLTQFNAEDVTTLSDEVVTPYKNAYSKGWPASQRHQLMMKACRDGADMATITGAPEFELGMMVYVAPEREQVYDLTILLNGCGDQNAFDGFPKEQEIIDDLITDPAVLGVLQGKIQRMLDLYVAAEFFSIEWIAYSAIYVIRKMLLPVLMPKLYAIWMQRIRDAFDDEGYQIFADSTLFFTNAANNFVPDSFRETLQAINAEAMGNLHEILTSAACKMSEGHAASIISIIRDVAKGIRQRMWY